MGKKSMTIGLMRRGLETMRIMGANLGRPIFLVLLAEMYDNIGQLEEGLSLLSEAEDASRENQELLFDSEILRLKGELSAAKGAEDAEVLSQIMRAAEVAGEQKARILELRAVASMNRYQAESGPDPESVEYLSKIYRWFTEGFESVDLDEARALLDA
jgi:hypothetical protein